MDSTRLVPSMKRILNEHASLRAMLQSILLMVDRGPQDDPERFFDVLRAMLFYIDEFPERRHHPKESNLLFPKVVRLVPSLLPTVEKLEHDHIKGEARVRSLQHDLLAWEILGDSRRECFSSAARDYVAFYLEHMRIEETCIFPAAREHLSAVDWQELNAAFETNQDPFADTGQPNTDYERMFTKIVLHAPEPIGVGRS
jgi:hemerythrin-like domain-containing protein